MQEQQKPILSFLIIMGMIGACIGGLSLRRQVDAGPTVPSASTEIIADNLIASKDNTAKLSESEYFYYLSQLLEKAYVDQIKDDTVLASGAVRGMVSSLADPDCNYYKVEQFAALKDRLAGKFEGIGAEFNLEYDQEQLKKVQNLEKDVDSLLLIPSLYVSAVVPGGPAEKAGMVPGDLILSVDGRWVLSSNDIKRLRQLQADAAANRIPKEVLEKARDEFRKKAEENTTPIRARDKLQVGKFGVRQVTWLHKGVEKKATITLVPSTVPALEKVNETTYRLRFLTGAAKLVSEANLGGKEVTLDLRDSTSGDFGSLVSVMNEVAPKGKVYGQLVTERSGTPKPVEVEKGSSNPPKFTLLVDSSTIGAAKVFAQAMASTGQAKLQGALPPGQSKWIERFVLPDGSGYSLATGVFRPENGGLK